MPDSGFVISPTVRVINASSVAIAGGSIEFYDAGTSTPRAVYSNSGLTASLGSTVYLDAGGHPVASLGSSTKVIVYTSASLVKMIVKDDASVTVATYDNVKVTEDTSAFGAGGGTADVVAGVVSKTADYTVLTTDQNKWFNCDPTGAGFTLTLPSAVTATDGWAVGVRHAGAASITNAVRLSTVAGQTISSDAVAGVTSIVITGGGEAVWIVSDGSGWSVISHTPPHIVSSGKTTLTVADRLSLPPASPDIGAFYIVAAAPAGAWVSYAEHDIIQIVGTSTYRRWTPPTDCGWLAYIQAEDVLTQFRASAWVDLTNITAPETSVLETALFLDQRADGVVGGTASVGAWTTATLQTTKLNTIEGCSLTSDVITLPAGSYFVVASKMMGSPNSVGVRLILGGGTIFEGINGGISGTEDSIMSVHAAFTLVASDTLTLQYYAQSSGTTSDLGSVLLIAGNLETYASVLILDLTSLQGPAGDRGAQGSISATPSGALTLANGANADVVIGTNQKHRITGPSGAFSVSGFVAPSNDGYVLFVYNPTAQTMTLTNDATSTAANRILTMTGSDVALTGPSMVMLIYDTTDARWLYHNQ
jgi:hypothetical protein